MPFIHYGDIDNKYVTPEHSTAYGGLAVGKTIEVGYLTYKAGEGAKRHQHPNEQIMVVLKGRLKVELDGEEQELGPKSGFYAPSNVPHTVTAVEDSEVLSCKDLVEGAGH